MIRSFVYRLYPTKAQEIKLLDTLGMCCELYNFCCLGCGHTENADVNATKNILKQGLKRAFSLKPEEVTQ